MSEMHYKAAYERWLSEPSVDAVTKAELLSIADNDDEIKQRFISYLSFGTAGLRGTMNAGTNAMNVYTVAHATQGMATLIAGKGEEAMKRGDLGVFALNKALQENVCYCRCGSRGAF